MTTKAGSSDVTLFAQDMYLRQVHHTVPLEKEAESILLQRCSSDCTARDRLVEAYQPLVLNIARQYHRRDGALELMDLVQEGNIGLLKALESFDPMVGTMFSTHAFNDIRGAISQALWQGESIIRLPYHKARALRRLDRIEAHLCVTLGRDPTQQELASALHLSLPDIRELLLLRTQQILQLDTLVINDLTVADLVAEVLATPQGDAALIREAIASLPPFERAYIATRYGSDGSSPVSQAQMARRLGMTRAQIEHLEWRARRHLADYLARAVA
jgi:RNA polymerase primary sigma factor